MDASKNTFVLSGRESHYERIRVALASALDGVPQILLLSGAAGSGKTTLIREFCQRMQQTDPDLLVVYTQCNSQSGAGDPYLPFKEALALLTGDAHEERDRKSLSAENSSRLGKFAGQAAEALVELGPDLIGVFLPVTGLVTKAGAFVAKKAGWVKKLEQAEGTSLLHENIKPDRFFEQFGRVLIHLVGKKPIILVIDDLHWADGGSLDLLFYLTRQVQNSNGARLLLIGAYRPDEISSGRGGARHPLEKNINEINRYWRNVNVDLASAIGADSGRRFINDLLDAEPNRLDADFRRQLFKHTEGQPLFVVEILRLLQDRNQLFKDGEGQWTLSQSVDFKDLPDNVKAVIRERIARLSQDLRDILTCGSVEGEHFTAEVVSRVRQVEELHLAGKLTEELERQHRLVEPEGEVRLNRKKLHIYHFVHTLFRQFIYDELSGMQKQLLHLAIGKTLEELYDADAKVIAAQLARHYIEAADEEKAIRYCVIAGDQAKLAYGYREAIHFYNLAVEMIAGGFGSEEQGHEIVRSLGDARGLSDSLRGIALVCLNRNDYPEAFKYAQDALNLYKQTGDRMGENETLRYIGDIHCGMGNYQQALEAYQEVLRIRREIGQRSLEGGALGDIGDVYLFLGLYEESLELHLRSLEINEEVNYKYGQTWCHHDMGVIHFNMGNLRDARQELELAVSLAEEIQARNLIVLSKNDLSVVLRELGDRESLETSLKLAREASELAEKVELVFGQIAGASNLARAYLRLGDPASAKEHSQWAIALLERHGAAEVLEEEIFFNHAEILNVSGETEDAKEYLKRAYDEVIDKANRINDQIIRNSFLENVRVNRAIITAYRAG
ncbi:MAG TPA: tetratricopeptide repeat protein [Blastocatellia bacterium]|nr:tetratricopeptide repeat protein [Blastocatellia bacterium]